MPPNRNFPSFPAGEFIRFKDAVLDEVEALIEKGCTGLAIESFSKRFNCPKLDVFVQIGSYCLQHNSSPEEKFFGAALCEIQVLSFVTAPRLSVPVSFHSPANGGMLPDAGW